MVEADRNPIPSSRAAEGLPDRRARCARPGHGGQGQSRRRLEIGANAPQCILRKQESSRFKHHSKETTWARSSASTSAPPTAASPSWKAANRRSSKTPKARAPRRPSSATRRRRNPVRRPAKRQAVTNPEHPYAVEAPDRPPLRRKGSAEGHRPDALQDRQGRQRRRLGQARDKKIAPPQVSAEVLRKMKKTAEDYLGEEVTEAVITVPAFSTTASARPPRTPAASPASGSQAHHQRTDRGGARLRHGQAGQGQARSPSMTWAAAPSTSPSSKSPTSMAKNSSKCWPPTATPSSAAKTSTSA